MAFLVDRSAAHRPLGFAAAVAPHATANRVARWLGFVAVERCANDQRGATTALLAPLPGIADVANLFTQRELARSGAETRGVLFAAGSLGASWIATATRGATSEVPVAWVSLRGADDAAAIEGDARTDGELAALIANSEVAGFERLAAAIDPLAPAALASTRGIVDGELVSLLGLASGALQPGARSPLRITMLTDARLDRATLESLWRESAQQALSTVAGLAVPRAADGVLALANGLAQSTRIEAGSIGFETLRVGATALLQELLRALLEKAWRPAPALLVQVSVVGARDPAEAAARAEALATDARLPEITRGQTIAEVGRTVVRRARDGHQVAVALNLGVGRFDATRWTSLPR